MQITIKDIKVATGVVKSGQNQGNPWKLVIITGEDGKEYTTFEASAETLTVGTVLKLDKVTITEKDGKTKHDFKEYVVVSEPTGGASPAPASLNGMTPDAWAEKDRLERRARASNTCFMGIMQLASTPNLNVNPKYLEKFEKAVEFAMDYAIVHLQPKTVEAKPEVKDQGDKDWQKIIDDGKVLTPEGFTKRCKDAGIPWLDVKAILGVNNVKEIANYAQAWATVKEEADKQAIKEGKGDSDITPEDLPLD